MADDMGIGDTSAYLEINLMEGTEPLSKTVKTPHIEKFAKEGTYSILVVVLSSHGLN